MLTSDPSDNQVVPLMIRTRRTLLANGEIQVQRSVACSRESCEVSLGACIRCEHCDGMVSRGSARDAYVFCNNPELAAAEIRYLPVRPAERPSSGRRSVCDYTPVAAVMSADVTCVRDDVSVEDVTALLLDRGFSGVPVVDSSGALLGVLSKADLVREGYEQGETQELQRSPTRGLAAGFHETQIARRMVGDIMLGMKFALPEDATLSQASALMAYEGVHRLPVTSAHGGCVVGIITPIDILRWIAERDGYLVRA